MRLICPNCGAQYEVADDAIPAAGRDVQCSNCGHGWFQGSHGAEVHGEAYPRTAEGDVETPDPIETAVPEPVATAAVVGTEPVTVEPEPDDDDHGDQETEPEPEPEAAPDPEAVDAAAAMPASLQPSLDDNLLAVLREEAEREVAQRRAETARTIETQADLGIEAAGAYVPPASAATRTPSPGRNEYSHLSSDADQEATVPPTSVRPAARRDLLPNVEEISSTLRSSSGARDDDDNPMPDLPPIRRSSGFRSGFLLSVLLAVIVVVAYVLAPRLAEQFPAAKGALDAFVMGVDTLRAWVRSIVASLTGMLEGQA